MVRVFEKVIQAAHWNIDKILAGVEIYQRMPSAVGRLVDPHSCETILRSDSAIMDSDIAEMIVAEIGFKKLPILRFGFYGDNATGRSGKPAKQAGEVTNVGADIEKIGARSTSIGFEKELCKSGFVNVPAIQASAYAVAFVALNLESKRQMAGGHGGAKRIGALRPVGEAAKLVLKSLTHEEKAKFITSGYKRRCGKVEF